MENLGIPPSETDAPLSQSLAVNYNRGIARARARPSGGLPMLSTNSITRLIQQIRQGDRAGVAPLLERYFRRVAGLARQRLRHAPRTGAGEEDVAQSAFRSLVRGLEDGRFTDLIDRNELWKMLFVLTTRKAIDQLRREGKHARLAARDEAALEQALANGPTPAVEAEIHDELERLLKLLGKADLRALARWKLEGYTNAEIAKRQNCVERNVDRRLRAISSIWEPEVLA